MDSWSIGPNKLPPDKRKLALKDQILKIEDALLPDIIA